SEIITQPNLTSQEFNSFETGAGLQTTPGGMGETPQSPAPGAPGTGAGGGGYGNIPGTTPLKPTPVDYCLLRFLDVTVEPGKSYRYRVKVKMANPNYSPEPGKRKDTYVQFAKDEVLTSDWAYVPQTVSVPADEFLYAVDQRNVEPKLKGYL